LGVVMTLPVTSGGKSAWEIRMTAAIGLPMKTEFEEGVMHVTLTLAEPLA